MCSRIYGFNVKEKLSFCWQYAVNDCSLIKNLPEVKFHYFSQKIQGEQLKLAKRKRIHAGDEDYEHN